jgi:hypothetical protein
MGRLFRGAMNVGIRDAIPSSSVGGGQGTDTGRLRVVFAATADTSIKPGAARMRPKARP